MLDDGPRARVEALLELMAPLPGNPEIVVRRDDLAALWAAYQGMVMERDQATINLVRIDQQYQAERAQGHAALLAIHQCAGDRYEAISGPFMTGDGAVDTAGAVDRLIVACAALESVERWALEALDGQVPSYYAELDRLRAERVQAAPVLAAVNEWWGVHGAVDHACGECRALRRAVESWRAARDGVRDVD